MLNPKNKQTVWPTHKRIFINKLGHRFTRLNSTRYFYFVRIVRLWNTIPNGILDLNLTVQTNKLCLREYLWGHFALNLKTKICPHITKQASELIQSRKYSITLCAIYAAHQKGTSDCGLFAIATATALCFGCT